MAPSGAAGETSCRRPSSASVSLQPGLSPVARSAAPATSGLLAALRICQWRGICQVCPPRPRASIATMTAFAL
jgi:hypothetical protein